MLFINFLQFNLLLASSLATSLKQTLTNTDTSETEVETTTSTAKVEFTDLIKANIKNTELPEILEIRLKENYENFKTQFKTYFQDIKEKNSPPCIDFWIEIVNMYPNDGRCDYFYTRNLFNIFFDMLIFDWSLQEKEINILEWNETFEAIFENIYEINQIVLILIKLRFTERHKRHTQNLPHQLKNIFREVFPDTLSDESTVDVDALSFEEKAVFERYPCFTLKNDNISTIFNSFKPDVIEILQSNANSLITEINKKWCDKLSTLMDVFYPTSITSIDFFQDLYKDWFLPDKKESGIISNKYLFEVKYRITGDFDYDFEKLYSLYNNEYLRKIYNDIKEMHKYQFLDFFLGSYIYDKTLNNETEASPNAQQEIENMKSILNYDEIFN